MPLTEDDILAAHGFTIETYAIACATYECERSNRQHAVVKAMDAFFRSPEQVALFIRRERAAMLRFAGDLVLGH